MDLKIATKIACLIVRWTKQMVQYNDYDYVLKPIKMTRFFKFRPAGGFSQNAFLAFKATLACQRLMILILREKDTQWQNLRKNLMDATASANEDKLNRKTSVHLTGQP
jgi:hypothetical protein